MFQISGFRVEGVVNLVTINDYKTESVHLVTLGGL